MLEGDTSYGGKIESGKCSQAGWGGQVFNQVVREGFTKSWHLSGDLKEVRKLAKQVPGRGGSRRGSSSDKGPKTGACLVVPGSVKIPAGGGAQRDYQGFRGPLSGPGRNGSQDRFWAERRRDMTFLHGVTLASRFMETVVSIKLSLHSRKL